MATLTGRPLAHYAVTKAPEERVPSKYARTEEIFWDGKFQKYPMQQEKSTVRSATKPTIEDSLLGSLAFKNRFAPSLQHVRTHAGFSLHRER